MPGGDLRDLLRQVLVAAEERHARDIVVLRLSEICSFCDYFVICHGESSVQVRAIAEHIDETLRKLSPKVLPLHVEGADDARWILMDYSEVVVHVFDEATRDFYRLERLWGTAPRVDPAELAGDAGSGGGGS